MKKMSEAKKLKPGPKRKLNDSARKRNKKAANAKLSKNRIYFGDEYDRWMEIKTTGTRIPDPPLLLIWFLLRLWYGSLSASISLSHLSIFYNISCYNSLVLLTFVSRASCRFT